MGRTNFLSKNKSSHHIREIKQKVYKEVRMSKKRVAAYARVSTNSRAQEHSFEFQSRYWNQTLGNNDEYEYIGLFADKGISGKYANRRPQFLALMELCNRGEVDIIFTKSVQRFARNAEELLKYVRELREKGIEVYFEKENIHTLNPDTELYLTIAAAIAEEDLIRYSNNVAWSIKDRFERGEMILGPRIYGYRKTAENRLVVYSDEARIVKLIFEEYIKGNVSTLQIAKRLNSMGIPSPNGGEWLCSQISYIIKNEKYYGDMILQKTFVEGGVKYANRGERVRYYVENSHEPIVSREIWDKAQEILAQRANPHLVGAKQKSYPFTGLIVCGECGANYTHKVNNSGTISQANFWKCHIAIQKGVKYCHNPGIKEKVLYDLFMDCYNEFVTEGYYKTNMDTGEDEQRLKELIETEKELTYLMMNGLLSRIQYAVEQQSVRREIQRISGKLQELRAREVQGSDFNTIGEFDEQKVYAFIKGVRIKNWTVTFEFYNGIEISRTYTNGQPGNIRDWKLKQKLRREQENG